MDIIRSIYKRFHLDDFTKNLDLVILSDVILTSIFIVIFCVLVHLLFNRAIKRIDKRKNFLLYAFLSSLPRTLYFIIFLYGFSFLVASIGFLNQFKILQLISVNIPLILLFVLGLFLVRFAEKSIHIINDIDCLPNVDKFVTSVVSKVVRVILFISFTIILLDNLGVKVTGLMAFAGIGAAAIGFASQNLVANFFGAFAIFLDRPFKMGDYIISQDKTIEGMVDDISWRVTKLVAPDGNNFYVPNSYFLTTGVKNESQSQGRRVRKTIGIRYQDIKHVKDIVNNVEQLVLVWPGVDLKRNNYVALIDFSAFSIDIYISFFLSIDEYSDFLKSQQDFLLEVVKIIHSFGADIAFPTTTIDFSNNIYSSSFKV
jgi:MscS family membrane protein